MSAGSFDVVIVVSKVFSMLSFNDRSLLLQLVADTKLIKLCIKGVNKILRIAKSFF